MADNGGNGGSSVSGDAFAGNAGPPSHFDSDDDNNVASEIDEYTTGIFGNGRLDRNH